MSELEGRVEKRDTGVQSTRQSSFTWESSGRRPQGKKREVMEVKGFLLSNSLFKGGFRGQGMNLVEE